MSGAPGWEKFLGGKTSTVNFTSEEVEKFQKQQQKSAALPLKKHSHPIIQPRNLDPAPQPPLRPRTSANGLLETSFDNDRLIVPASEPIGIASGSIAAEPSEPSSHATPKATAPLQPPSSSMVSNLAKSTPSLFNRQPQQPPVNNKSNCDSKRKNWSKNSLESLRTVINEPIHEAASPVSRGCQFVTVTSSQQ